MYSVNGSELKPVRELTPGETRLSHVTGAALSPDGQIMAAWGTDLRLFIVPLLSIKYALGFRVHGSCAWKDGTRVGKAKYVGLSRTGPLVEGAWLLDRLLLASAQGQIAVPSSRSRRL